MQQFDRPTGARRIAAMKQLADGLYELRGFPPDAINVYLMGDVIVDAATRHAGRRILRQVRGHHVAAHALTHAHPDHQGASKEIRSGAAVTTPTRWRAATSSRSAIR
jgi:glyoxylase-like metal-dependent hydrolase (beta-lactamase superfamily II)